MGKGYVKFFREMIDHPIVSKNANYFTVFSHLLLNASHAGYSVIFRGRRIQLKAGQLTIGREQIAKKWKIPSSTVYDILKTFEKEGMITMESDRQCTLITIVNWAEYQLQESSLGRSSDEVRMKFGRKSATIRQRDEAESPVISRVFPFE